MKRMIITCLCLASAICAVLVQPASAQDQKQAIQEKVAAFKQATAENQKALHQYTWIEDTQLSLKGEVKSTKIESCRYGPDGKVQKTPLSAPPEKKEMRGLKKKIAKKKTDEMKDYMERVVSLIQRYVPPQPELIKADVAGGNASFSPQPGGMLLQFKNFVKSGDLVSFTLDTAAKAIRQVKVDTYLDDADKAKVALAVDFQTLPDGTNYAASKKLDVAAKKIVVAITTKNFQKLAQ
jgi:gas vesicle protein